MNQNRRVVQGAILTGALTIMTTISAANTTTPQVTAAPSPIVTQTSATGTAGVIRYLGEAATGSLQNVSVNVLQNEVVLLAEADDIDGTPTAGIVADLIPDELVAAVTESDVTETADAADEIVGAFMDQLEASEQTEVSESVGVDAEEAEEIPAEAQVETGEAADPDSEVVEEDVETAVAAGWENTLMAVVEESLNVREAADEESAVIGKLYAGATAEVVEQGETWTRISSGSVDGYVKNEYCVFGADAYEYAKEACNETATTLTGGLRFRAEASEDAGVISTLEEGTNLTVRKDAEAPDGWVAVSYSGSDGYVAEDYVDISLTTLSAMTIEEEQAKLEAEQAEKAKSEQVTQSTGATQTAATSASYDDVTLLAALIQCESGTQPYEGQVAVGNVVVNRLRTGAYGGSIASVIYAPGQFSPAASGAVARVAAAGPSGTAMAAAQAAINGESYVGGCTQFRNVACGHPGIVIGSHVFW